jgi:ABC-2 type transport system ATP-binding protein
MEIVLTDVCKSFDGKPIIKELSFAVGSGEVVGLLGPSGSGKTTTIRLLIGAIAADSGTITFDGTAVPDLRLLRRIGFMPQNDALYNDLSGEDNLSFFAELYGLGKLEAAKCIGRVLDIVGLTGDRKKFVRDYSGGMKKRLSLAAALAHEPDVLLLDEPTVGIDPVLRRSIWDWFIELKKAGTTLIVSTHVMDEAVECDKAVLLYNGRLIHYDTVEALLDRTENGKVEDLFFAAAEREGGGAV